MTQEANELLEKALTLPEADRAELAGNLMASLDAAVDPDVDAAWQEEVARRRRDIQSGKVKSIAWEEVQRKGSTLLHGEYTASLSSGGGTRVSDGFKLVSEA
jgi:putative addiction module component (TIGR02574 family)